MIYEVKCCVSNQEEVGFIESIFKDYGFNAKSDCPLIVRVKEKKGMKKKIQEFIDRKEIPAFVVER